LYLRRERKDNLERCLVYIAKTMDLSETEYITQLHKDPVALADRLAAVEIKTEDVN